MPRKHLPRRSDSEWFRLITECRQSGLCDSHWCRINNIPPTSFFSAIRRLRDKACALPGRMIQSDTSLNHTFRQDVVELDIKQDATPVNCDETLPAVHAVTASSSYLDNSHTIEIQMGDNVVRLSNNADPTLVKIITLSLMGGGHYAC